MTVLPDLLPGGVEHALEPGRVGRRQERHAVSADAGLNRPVPLIEGFSLRRLMSRNGPPFEPSTRSALTVRDVEPLLPEDGNCFAPTIAVIL